MTGSAPLTPPRKTGALVLADGRMAMGIGLGAAGATAGEVVFNTAMTGYQEILSDPSYAGQIVTFTFPHIGNVGANADDMEAAQVHARGLIIRAGITGPANFRALQPLNDWLADRGLIGLAGIDTRALTAELREKGALNAAIAHTPDGAFDRAALQAQARDFSGLDGANLAPEVACTEPYEWTESAWARTGKDAPYTYPPLARPRHRLIAIDYGVKRNILRQLTSLGCAITVVPHDTPAEAIVARKPDGVVLSNGPGDPAAMEAALPPIRSLIEAGLPVLGICLGHQLLALALGARTRKMAFGHHGANHPVQDLTTGKVEIVSMNHGFTVDRESLPAGLEETHSSLFDGSNCGIRLSGKPVFAVQYHPEASPGPHDSHYLFQRFVDLLEPRA